VHSGPNRVLRRSVFGRTFDQKFAECLDQLRKHTESVEKAADVARIIEEANARDELTNVKTELWCVKAQLEQLQLSIRFGERSTCPAHCRAVNG
jgi:hypothetical protein